MNTQQMALVNKFSIAVRLLSTSQLQNSLFTPLSSLKVRNCTMLALVNAVKGALVSSIGHLITIPIYAIAYTLIALHIWCWILYGFLIDLLWIAEEPPMFAISLYCILSHWFKANQRQIHPLPLSRRADTPAFSIVQASVILLFVWSVPDSLATVSGDWPNFEITFDDRLW